MTTDFRALCAELLDEMDYYTDWSDAKEVKDRARAALAESSPEGELTDEELAAIAADRARRPAPEPPADGEVAELVAALRQAAQNLTPHPSIVPLEAVRFHRAAELLQLQHPQPVPVSEQPDQRYPECVKAWPDCWDGGYDPRCCRFPKSCSCEVRYDLPLPSGEVE